MKRAEHKAKLMKDPQFRKAWKELEAEYQRMRGEVQKRLNSSHSNEE